MIKKVRWWKNSSSTISPFQPYPTWLIDVHEAHYLKCQTLMYNPGVKNDKEEAMIEAFIYLKYWADEDGITRRWLS